MIYGKNHPKKGVKGRNMTISLFKVLFDAATSNQVYIVTGIVSKDLSPRV